MKKILLLFILLTGSLYAQPPIGQPNNLAICDQNSDGFEAFDLTVTIPEILNGLNPSLYSITFYTSLADAQNEMAPIANPAAYINSSNPQTIFVRVLEDANPANFAITSFDLIVNPFPSIVQPSNLVIYQSPFVGTATFDLSSQTAFLINGNSSAFVSYYVTETDAVSGSSMIVSATAFSNTTNPQTIYTRVENTDTGCFSITSFDLIVAEDGIIFFPDANFKQQLLNANPSNFIALNHLGNQITIDINDDNEIQFSEALLVSSLSVNSNNNISQIVGIEYFQNLSYLSCSNTSITSLNLSSLVNLKTLQCNNSLLTSINVSGMTNLENLYVIGNQLVSLDLHDLENLKVVLCSDNSISNINLNGLINLYQLTCTNNDITSLNLDSLFDLTVLYCDNNQISSLSFDGLSNLSTIQADDNQLSFVEIINCPQIFQAGFSNNILSTINLSGTTDIEFLSINNNNFSDINFVTSLSSLRSLNCSNNLVGNLDFVGSILDLQFLNCSNTLISTLDLSANQNFISLQCTNNPNLISVFLKFGREYELTIQNGYPMNNNPNLQYVCVDDYRISTFANYFALNNMNNVVVNSYCSFNPGGDYNTITGTIQYDFNNNGCDTSDPYANYFGLEVNIDGMTTNSSVYSNGLGVYNLFTSNTGVYSLVPNLENASYFTVTPFSAEFPVMTIDNSTVTQNFCISANGVHPDLEVVIAPVIPARPGFEAVYKIVYKNKGNQIMSQNYGLNFFYNHNLMSLVSTSVVPSAQATGGLQWDYANLMPFESRSILVTFLINAPTDTTNPVNIDDVLTFTSVILPQAGDVAVTDNTFVFNQSVVGSYDPNDITCLQGEVVSPSEIGEFLHYMIRFENTGNAPAENIVVKTEINASQFNVNSLQMIAASHNATIRRNGNKIEFIFQNIQLDSGGHGNILLKIKSKGDLQEGDFVAKYANIYFDYNFPIETNEAETLFVALSTNNPEWSTSVSVYPNSVKDVVTITSSDKTIKSIELYDANGRLLQTQLVNNLTTALNMLERASGMYFIKIATDSGSMIEKLIKN